MRAGDLNGSVSAGPVTLPLHPAGTARRCYPRDAGADTADVITTLPAPVEADRPHRSTRPDVVALVIVLGGSLAHQLAYGALADEAFIPLRYAAHLLAGDGLVFNPGERVEGFPNLLWVLAVAAGGLVHENLADVARVLGVVCTLGVVAAVQRFVHRGTGSGWSAVAAAALTAVAAPAAALGPSGLEAPAFALAVLGALLAVQARRPVAAGLLLAVATMLRLDGAVVAVVVLAAVLLTWAWRPALWLVAATVVPLAEWMAWRFAYYGGHLLPTPLAARAGYGEGRLLTGGLSDLGELAAASWPLVLAAAAGTAAVVRWGDHRTKALTGLVAAVVVTHVALVAVTGGDGTPWRSLAPDVPLLAVLTGLGVAVLPGLQWRAVVAGGLAVAVAAGASSSLSLSLEQVRSGQQQVDQFAATGAWLQRRLPAGTVIATIAGGALSHAARDLTVVDMLGRTDDRIARGGERDAGSAVGRGAHDYPYVLDVRRPALITAGAWTPAPSCEVPEVLGDYRAALHSPEPGWWTTVYLRPDLAGSLAGELDEARFRRQPC